MAAAKPYSESDISGPQGTLFYTRTYLPPSDAKPKALLVAIHGFNEHVDRFTHIHPEFAKRGIAVFTYDQRGFGQTVQKKENGAGKKYAQTSWREQLEDIEWAITEGKKVAGCENVPIFLMGHSMGGGLSLAFSTRSGPQWPHPSAETRASLSGVIATSPLITQTKPASKVMRWIGGKAGLITPGTVIPAEVKADDLSHDPKVVEAYAKDPLIRQVGSLRGISDMLNGGEQLLATDYKNWPKGLPLLIIHGTDDKVCSVKSAQTFFDSVVADDKKISLYDGGYHELQNEPDGVKEKLVEECITWIEAHIPTATTTAAIEEPAANTSKL